MEANSPSPPVSSPKPAVQSPTQTMPLWKRAARALPVTLVLIALVWIFGRVGVLHKLETLVADTQSRITSPPPESKVAIVDIDNEDYKRTFKITSPLDPKELKKLIEDIAKGQPHVIAVDIDTSASQFQGLEVLARNSQIVWARGVKGIEKADSRDVQPLKVLGGTKQCDVPSGLALLIDDDEDKVTRRYKRVIPSDQDQGYPDSFPWAVVKQFRKQTAERGEPQLAKLKGSTDDLMIGYSGDSQGSHRIKFTAGKVRALADGWPATSPFRNKIVLLGGSYLEEDRHDTPIGRLTGMEIMANVIETELSGGGHEAPSRFVIGALEFFDAFVLLRLFHFLRPLRKALFWSVVLSLALSIFCSYLTFGTVTQLGQFLAILLGLIIFESLEHYRRLKVPEIFLRIFGGPTSQAP